jgi:hypothetical protein
MGTITISTLFYGIQIHIDKHKYILMCEFGILSQGHALTISHTLTDLS